MGEQKEDATSYDKSAAPAYDAPITAVYQIGMHCEGCACKIRRVVKNYDGVFDVKSNCPANKLTVTGKIDPTKVKEKLEQKIRKRVELIAPPPEKDDGVAAGDKNGNEKPEKTPEEVSTVILKIRLHCHDCIQKIRKIIMKITGVESVDVQSGQDLVTVKGTMDLKQLVPYLKQKLSRNVELIPPKKDGGAAVETKQENVTGSGEERDEETPAAEQEAKEPAAAAGGENKQKEAVSNEEKKEKEGSSDDKKHGTEEAAVNGDESGSECVVAANKTGFYGYPKNAHPSYFHGGTLGSSSYINSYANEAQPSNPTHEYLNPGYVNHGYVNQGYVIPPQLHAPQMFSDENPHACSIM